VIILNLIYPDYYKTFKCISSNCKHNCCIGWEIDIDDTSYSIYSNINNNFGKRLREEIIHNDIPCFKQDKSGRCAFLNDEGLCEIILNLGEDYLCDICYDHPRFRNFYSSFTEIGLGLCCEEAARIILDNKNIVQFIHNTTDKIILTEDEVNFLNKRNKILDIVQKRNLPFIDRITIIEEEYSLNQQYLSPFEFAQIYHKFERLDNEWDEYIDLPENALEYKIPKNMDIVLEQLLVYFIYRHLSDSLYEHNFEKRLSFCIHAVEFLSTIYFYNDKNINFNELCRMYSCEIEYSDENLNKLINLM